MFRSWKRRWEALRNGRPGARFTEVYDERHGEAANPVQRFITLGAGILVFAAGIFFMPAPGPGIAILVVGAGLIAQESRTAARALDGAELRIRALAGFALRIWRDASLAGQLGITVAGIVVTGAALFFAYWFLFG
jgi:hypothetical protein